jgi:hypothetical protein
MVAEQFLHHGSHKCQRLAAARARAPHHVLACQNLLEGAGLCDTPGERKAGERETRERQEREGDERDETGKREKRERASA